MCELPQGLLLAVHLCRVKEKLQALLNVDRQFSEDDFEKVFISYLFYCCKNVSSFFHARKKTKRWNMMVCMVFTAVKTDVVSCSVITFSALIFAGGWCYFYRTE